MDNLKNPHLANDPPKFSLSHIFQTIRESHLFSQSSIGFDFGESYLKIVQVQKTRLGYFVTNYLLRMLLPTVRGDPLEKKKFIQESIKEFLTKYRIRTRLGRLIIGGRGVFIFSMTLPPLSKRDLKGAISIELKKYLPSVDLKSINFDFMVTGTISDATKKTNLEITCIAVEIDRLNENISLLKEIGIRPVIIGVSADVLGNLLRFSLKDTYYTQTLAYLDLGAFASRLGIYKKGNLHFFREIPIGGEHITQAMSKTITTSLGPRNIIPEEAEKIKRQWGIPLDEEVVDYPTDFGVLSGILIFSLISPVFERLVGELISTFNYYYKTFGVSKLDVLYLTGGSSNLKNIEKFLVRNLNEVVNKVERLDLSKVVKSCLASREAVEEPLREESIFHLSSALGVCLGRGGKINFLPLKERIEQRLNFTSFVVRFLFLFFLTLTLSFYTLTYMNAMRFKVLINRTEPAIKNLEPMVLKVKDYLSLKSKLSEKRSLLEKAIGNQPLWSGLLKELSNITPDEVVLKRLVTTPDEPRCIRIIGEIFVEYTTVDFVLSSYLTALSDSVYFSRVDLVSSQIDISSTIPKADFEIICELRY